MRSGRDVGAAIFFPALLSGDVAKNGVKEGLGEEMGTRGCDAEDDYRFNSMLCASYRTCEARAAYSSSSALIERERSALEGSTRASRCRRSGTENVGLSNTNIGENPMPRKPKGSSVRFIHEGKSMKLRCRRCKCYSGGGPRSFLALQDAVGFWLERCSNCGRVWRQKRVLSLTLGDSDYH
ncbi:hypothetical protein KSP40_PGU011123 [Platanthera guangdongensis]|uniref:Uncharacterized protein n=1 Tax=Platanthera guangdongensis TaxID=2320717 RepID=A0ABR2LJ16_9ASPA